MKRYYSLFLVLYYLSVVLPHEQVGRFLASIFLPGSRTRYDNVMLGGFAVIIVLIALWIWKKLRQEDTRILLFFGMSTLCFIVLCVHVLFVLNVEAVHFIQYAVFAIICFNINQSYLKTMFWSVIAGAIDELYQYMYLAPQKSEYYDFNDVIINAVGAGIGLIIIRTIRRQSVHVHIKSLFRSIEFWTFISLIAFTLIGLVSGILSYGPSEDALFCFMKVERLDFWYVAPTGPEIRFHVAKPIEGIIVTLALIVFYAFLQQGTSDISKATNK